MTTAEQTDLPELTFPRGLPGFEALHRFVLSQWGDGDSPYARLVSLEEPDTAFLVAPPEEFFDDYDVEVDDADAELLELADAGEALVLVVITVGEKAEEATANLLGPIVVNTRTRRGAQVVQAGELGTRVPLVGA